MSKKLKSIHFFMHYFFFFNKKQTFMLRMPWAHQSLRKNQSNEPSNSRTKK